jgi:hypothetical protein
MNEIEEFLRRAAALREQQARQRAQPLGPAVPSGELAPPSSEVMDAEIVSTDEVSGDDVADHVQRHLSPQSFQDRAQRVAARIKSADDDMDAHLHEKFEHRLGTLGATTSRAEASTMEKAESAPLEATGSSLAALIRSPQSLRNAIVLNELLTPPWHRW